MTLGHGSRWIPMPRLILNVSPGVGHSKNTIINPRDFWSIARLSRIRQGHLREAKEANPRLLFNLRLGSGVDLSKVPIFLSIPLQRVKPGGRLLQSCIRVGWIALLFQTIAARNADQRRRARNLPLGTWLKIVEVAEEKRIYISPHFSIKAHINLYLHTFKTEVSSLHAFKSKSTQNGPTTNQLRPAIHCSRIRPGFGTKLFYHPSNYGCHGREMEFCHVCPPE